jgi:hypothetical protein
MPLVVLQWLAVLAGAGLVAYGVFVVPTPEGMAPLLEDRWSNQRHWEDAPIFLGVWALTAIVGRLRNARATFPLLLGLGLLPLVAGVGFGPIVTVLAILAAGYAIGEHARTLALGREAPRGASDDVVSCALGTLVLSTAVALTSRLPIHYTGTYAAVLGLALFSNRGAIRRLALLPSLASSAPRSLSLAEYAGLTATLFSLSFLAACAARPEIYFDALAMHLPICHELATRHALAYDHVAHVWALMPAGGDLAYAIAYMLAGEAGAKLSAFAFLGLSTALLVTQVRRHTLPAAGYLHVLAFVGTGLAYLVTVSLFVDNVVLTCALGTAVGLLEYARSGRRGYLLLGSAFLGASIAAKMTSGFLGIASVLALGLLVWRRSDLRPSVRTLATAALVVALFGAFPYANAWATSGNPVFPFFNGLFQSDDFDATRNFRSAYHLPLRATTPFDATFFTSKYLEAKPGAFGFSLLLLLPSALVAWLTRRTPFAATTALIGGLFFCGVFVFQSYLRYVYPACGVLCLATALAVARPEIHASARVALHALLLVTVGLNWWCLPGGAWIQQTFPLRVLLRGEAETLRFTPESKLVAYVNARYGRDVKVGFAGRPFVGALDGDAEVWAWHSPAFATALDRAEDAAAVAEVARAHGITHFITPDKPRTEAFGAYLARYTELEYTAGGLQLRRCEHEADDVAAAPRDATDPDGPGAAGVAESSATPGGDVVDPKTSILADGTFTAGKASWSFGDGVEIEAESVAVVTTGILLQQVVVQENARYRFFLDAFGPRDRNGLQVHVIWRNARNEHIEATTAVLDVGPDPRRHHCDMVAPPGSVAAAVRIAARGAEPEVRIRRVACHEIR